MSDKKRTLSEDSPGELHPSKKQALDAEMEEDIDVGDSVEATQTQSQEIHKRSGNSGSQHLVSWDQIDFETLPPLDDKVSFFLSFLLLPSFLLLVRLVLFEHEFANCLFFRFLFSQRDPELLKVQNSALARQIKLYRDEGESLRRKLEKQKSVADQRLREVGQVSQAWAQVPTPFLFLFPSSSLGPLAEYHVICGSS